MTNSRLTDPEVLETRFPVLLEGFSIRQGSGGGGASTGGNGAVRRVRFLEPMTAGILSNRRRVPPFGAVGGDPGQVGINRVERAHGTVEALGATAEVEMTPGDVFVIETPGGGFRGGFSLDRRGASVALCSSFSNSGRGRGVRGEAQSVADHRGRGAGDGGAGGGGRGRRRGRALAGGRRYAGPVRQGV
nr:hydantoinase B/oxoprolinase family protein [Brevundimonas goettingensis]